MPPEISAPENAERDVIEGGFEIGRPPDILHCRNDPVIRAVQPREGMMVLFPAYLYHRTIPFKSDEKRICIAFDVVPA